MDTLIHADIFFFVTTIAVVVLGIIFAVVLIYIAKILSDLKKISAEVHEETVLFRKDLGDLRSEVKREGFKLKSMVDVAAKFIGRRKTSRSKKAA